jgi:3-oxoacyl-[acyl-carrier protein] reductase
VIVADRDMARAEAVVGAITAKGGLAKAIGGDVSDPAVVEGLVAKAVAEGGRLDLLVNNAGITKDMLAMRLKDEDWDQVIQTNLSSVFRLCRVSIRPMMKQRYGRIINITSVVGASGNAGQANYATAKAGIVGLTRALACEFSPRGVTVNCVVPGKIGGKRSATSGKGIDAAPITTEEGAVEDVARMIAHLCLPASRYITGQSLHVSGGMFMP